jgi:hypothetical protein
VYSMVPPVGLTGGGTVCTLSTDSVWAGPLAVPASAHVMPEPRFVLRQSLLSVIVLVSVAVAVLSGAAELTDGLSPRAIIVAMTTPAPPRRLDLLFRFIVIRRFYRWVRLIPSEGTPETMADPKPHP